jgi:membrane protease YdiL (CAAX protease family)
VWRYALLLLGMPVATIAVAAATGTLAVLDSWLRAGIGYLFQVVTGALIYNLWEETAWTGFLQSRLLDRHSLLRSALLTAPLFVAIHIPLSFAPGWTWPNTLLNLGLLIVAAPFLRYLIGVHYLGTGGSLLAVGLQHPSFNAAAAFGVGGWEYIPGLVVLTLLVALGRRLVRTPTPG